MRMLSRIIFVAMLAMAVIIIPLGTATIVSPLEPAIALVLPDGSYLRAVVYEDDHFPAINIYWDHDGGKASELLCFAEYNSERDEGAQICIGTYASGEDETKYYAPYMAERNNEP